VQACLTALSDWRQPVGRKQESNKYDKLIDPAVRVWCCHCHLVFISDLDEDNIHVRISFKISGDIVFFWLSYSAGFPDDVF
jgi:hypothetical protein